MILSANVVQDGRRVTEASQRLSANVELVDQALHDQKRPPDQTPRLKKADLN